MNIEDIIDFSKYTHEITLEKEELMNLNLTWSPWDHRPLCDANTIYHIKYPTTTELPKGLVRLHGEKVKVYNTMTSFDFLPIYSAPNTKFENTEYKDWDFYPLVSQDTRVIDKLKTTCIYLNKEKSMMISGGILSFTLPDYTGHHNESMS